MADVTREEVNSFLYHFTSTYEKGSPEFFDLFAPDATIFTVSSPNRIDGRDAFRHGFEPQLTSKVKRISQILSPEITPLPNGALVSYHNRIQIDGRPFNLRSSLFLTRGPRGDLQISHLHNSPQITTGVPVAAHDPETIHILEERVATAIGTVGTPK